MLAPVRKSIVVAEDFYDDPDAVVRWARDQSWYYPYQADADVHSGRVRFSWTTTWFRSAESCPFKSSSGLIDRLEALTGDVIDLDHWKAPFPVTAEGKADPRCRDVEPRSCLWNCSFHVKSGHYSQALGEGVHNHVTDGWNGVTERGWAGLIYLNRDAPLDGGLHLWRNVDPARNYDWMTSADNWEHVDSFGNVYNRLVLVRGDIPHSGAAGWGSTIDHGRLYQTFFFRVLESRRADNADATAVLR
jgi:hypothetical protein